MKRLLIIPVLLALLVSSCDDTAKTIWLDHDDPRIYIPQNGVAFNTVWVLESNEYTMNYGVYLSGVRPENQKSSITVTFSVQPQLITEYNAGGNIYSGQVQALPANCFEISGTSTTIASGQNFATIPIKIKTDLADALPKTDAFGQPILYTIPLALESVSKYSLVEEQGRREALIVVQLDHPKFFFWNNRNGQVVIGRRVVYGFEPVTENFKVTSVGLKNDQAYTLTFAVDPAAVPVGGTILPADAYELPASTVQIPVGSYEASFPVKIINNNIAFRQTFFLPVRITATSKYSADVEKGVLVLRVEVKNDYEWSYRSIITSLLTQTGRSANYSVTKAPTTHDAETIRIQMSTNGTNAGTTFNNKFYRLKVIPNPADSRNWGLELIRITDEGTANSPVDLELNPNKTSYYDWDYETFYLNYRWRSGTFWVEVSEILSAQF
ncbi:MAG: DUF1735 domain-containing protein [Bacteroidetes bacterium]|nr:DUF1735 domain-containing protein [Bacteroidota bacterium]